MRRTLALIVILIATALLAVGGAAGSAPGTAPAHTSTGPVPPANVSRPVDAAAGARGAAGEYVIAGVPSYIWRDGCAPTSLGMVIGYYDTHGYDDLIAGDASTQTTAVSQAVASHAMGGPARHYEDYSLPNDSSGAPQADRSELPSGDEHASDSIADYMHTSWSVEGLTYGSSWTSSVAPAFATYIAATAPGTTTTARDYRWSGSGSSALTWDLVKAEIDAWRPLVLMVDSSGDGAVDHAIVGIGYRETAGYPEYACWDTWYHTVRWARYRAVSATYAWGVWGATTLSLGGGPTPGPTPTPTPSPTPTTPAPAPSPTPSPSPDDDFTPPVTEVQGAGSAWHAGPVWLTFTASDGSSGVARTESRLGSSGAWVAGEGRLVEGQGVHTVQYRSVDLAGNVETTRTCTVRIDTAAPATTAWPTGAARGSQVSLRYRVGDLAPRATVRLVIVDSGGTPRKTIRLGQRTTGKTHAYRFVLKLPRGSYRYSVRATDLAGNAVQRPGSARLVVH